MKEKDHISIIQINIPRTWTRHLLNKLLEFLHFSVWMLTWDVLFQKAHFEQRFENINNPRITFLHSMQYSKQKEWRRDWERKRLCIFFFVSLYNPSKYNMLFPHIHNIKRTKRMLMLTLNLFTDCSLKRYHT